MYDEKALKLKHLAKVACCAGSRVGCRRFEGCIFKGIIIVYIRLQIQRLHICTLPQRDRRVNPLTLTRELSLAAPLRALCVLLQMRLFVSFDDMIG